MFRNVYDAGTGNANAPVIPRETSSQKRELAQALVDFGNREVSEHEKRCNKAAEPQTTRKRSFTCEEVKQTHVCLDGKAKPWSKWECRSCSKCRKLSVKLYCDNEDHVTREGTFPRWRDCRLCRPKHFQACAEKKICEHHKKSVSGCLLDVPACKPSD